MMVCSLVDGRRIRSARCKFVALALTFIACLPTVLAVALPFETNKFVAVSNDDVPERLKLPTKEYKGKLTFNKATISGGFGSFLAIRMIADECVDDFCRTYADQLQNSIVRCPRGLGAGAVGLEETARS